MDYKLLALDLDGTTLNHQLEILPQVRRAIAAAQQRGVVVTIATGRMFGATLPYALGLNVQGPLICFQGALIRDSQTGEVYHHTTLPGALAAEAIELLVAADIFVIAYIDERLWVARQRPELDLYLSWHPERPEVVIDPNLASTIASASIARLLTQAETAVAPNLADTVAANPPTKLLFVAEPDVVGRELIRLSAHFAGRLSVFRSHSLFGELTSLGVNKGVALAQLAARLGIPREQVIAIGDHENDLEMLKWAGLGLAMGNGIPAVHAIADAIIPSVEEAGVAWAIEHYILAS
ncbi:MAG: Cof-type HAD-IIB family hydrolase [Roseiflexaceae bacterium]